MSNPSAEGSKPSTSQEPLSGSTDSRQVLIEPPLMIPVLRIFSDGTYTFQRINSTTDGVSLATGDLDLGHVPDVRKEWNNASSWDQRLCIRAEIDPEVNDGDFPALNFCVPGIYYMMICRLKELGQHEAVQASEPKVDVCGDAFIFKVTENHRDVHGRAIFKLVPLEILAMGFPRWLLQQISTGWEGGTMGREFFPLNKKSD